MSGLQERAVARADADNERRFSQPVKGIPRIYFLLQSTFSLNQQKPKVSGALF